MFIDVFKNTGKDYLRLVESYRSETPEGKKVIRKRIICNIGPLSNVSSIEKNQSTRHKIPFGVSEVEQIEGFLGKKE